MESVAHLVFYIIILGLLNCFKNHVLQKVANVTTKKILLEEKQEFDFQRHSEGRKLFSLGIYYIKAVFFCRSKVTEGNHTFQKSKAKY